MLLPITRRLSSIFSLLLVASTFVFAIWTSITWMSSTVESASAPTHPAMMLSVSSAPTLSSNPESSAVPAANSQEKFATVGDLLQLEFYERLTEENQTWSRQHTRKPLNNFQLRAELTGEYEVKEDGAIVLPLLGPVKVMDRTTAEFESDVATSFERQIGTFAFMSVKVDRKPIYIVGPVKKSGAQKYSAGMTVLHAVALAGGIDRAAVDVAYMLRAVQEAGNQQKGFDQLKRYWARLSVLEAERDGKALALSVPLVALIGDDNAKSVTDAEKSLRRLEVATRDAQLASLAQSMESVKSEVDSKKERAAQVEKNVDLRAERATTLRGMKDQTRRFAIVQAESELSDTKERMHEAKANIDDAEDRLQKIEKERLLLVSRSRADLEREILNLTGQIAEAVNNVSANEGALDVMRTSLATGDNGFDGNVEFEIVRTGSKDRSIFAAQGTDELRSGDLVRVKVGRTGPGRSSLIR